MGKKSKKSKKSIKVDEPEQATSAEGLVRSSGPASGVPDGDEAEGPKRKMKRKAYEAEMRILQGELVAMQEWVKATGAKVCVVFEGLDSAGKGGTIRRITERTSPRVFKHIALPVPTEREKSQMYVQRYITHFPAAGEVVIFDRSWYNRAGVELVLGYCTREQTERFLEMVPAVERAMVRSGGHDRSGGRPWASPSLGCNVTDEAGQGAIPCTLSRWMRCCGCDHRARRLALAAIVRKRCVAGPSHYAPRLGYSCSAARRRSRAARMLCSARAPLIPP